MFLGYYIKYFHLCLEIGTLNVRFWYHFFLGAFTQFRKATISFAISQWTDFQEI